MFRTLNCLAFDHNLWLVLVAAAICVLGSLTTMRVFQRATAATGAEQVGWLAAAAMAGGCAIWSTHFIAMLAYQAPVEIQFALGPTVLSLVIAIVLPGTGYALATRLNVWAVGAGGALLGCGIAIMHYVGMSGLVLPGFITFDGSLVAASIVLSVAFATAALLAVRQVPGQRGLVAGSVLFVCSESSACISRAWAPSPSCRIRRGAFPKTLFPTRSWPSEWC